MRDKALDLIVEKIEPVLIKRKYKKARGLKKDDKGRFVLFRSESSAYSVLMSESPSVFELRFAEIVSDEEETLNWSVVSSCLWSEEDTLEQAESIANDFLDILGDESQKSEIIAAKKRAHNERNENADPNPLFFFKRLVAVFPELKREIDIECNSYEKFRSLTFAREHVLPKVKAQAKKKGAESTKKLANFFTDFYKEGDVDTRSIIRMVLINGIDSDEDRANILEFMEESFCRSYKKAIKFKDRRVRPEKIKKYKKRKISSRYTYVEGQKLDPHR